MARQQSGAEGGTDTTAPAACQSVKACGDQSAKLDVYEGMWHVFPQYDLPESRVAVAKSAKFVNDHLDQTNR